MKNQESKPIDCNWVVLFHREITVVKINAKLITHYHELILRCLRYESKEISIYVDGFIFCCTMMMMMMIIILLLYIVY
jgi:hypothetical protein